MSRFETDGVKEHLFNKESDAVFEATYGLQVGAVDVGAPRPSKGSKSKLTTKPSCSTMIICAFSAR